ncbi:MAG: SDR family oxidoreductase [Clostridiales bacterium]|nr:SDR family oxidoreductase [Clostridiales bacterium]
MSRKTVLITGGSRGIGKAIAREFAQNGWRVAISYNKNESSAFELAEEFPGQIAAIKADLKNISDTQALFVKAKESIGVIEVLVNNAGISMQKMINDTTYEDWREMMAVNLDSAFLLSKLALLDMISQKSGRIINISSMWGQVGASCEVAYSASKAGLIGFTKALAQEVGPSGITVNCIAPGVIDTDMNSMHSKETISELVDMTPMCRLGTPCDVAKTAFFLAGEGASFITGQVIGVSGGFVIT